MQIVTCIIIRLIHISRQPKSPINKIDTLNMMELKSLKTIKRCHFSFTRRINDKIERFHEFFRIPSIKCKDGRRDDFCMSIHFCMPCIIIFFIIFVIFSKSNCKLTSILPRLPVANSTLVV